MILFFHILSLNKIIEKNILFKIYQKLVKVFQIIQNSIFHIDSYFVESFIVLTEVFDDFYIFNFLLMLFTKSVYMDQRQCCFLFYAYFLPPNINSFDPIKVAQ